jgi:hypothetical protein
MSKVKIKLSLKKKKANEESRNKPFMESDAVVMLKSVEKTSPK